MDDTNRPQDAAQDAIGEPADNTAEAHNGGDKPSRVILLPNGGRPLFPGAMAPFSISDRIAVQEAVDHHDAVLGVVQTIDPQQTTVSGLDEIYPIGLCARMVRNLEEGETGQEPSGQEVMVLSPFNGGEIEGGDARPLHILMKGGPRFKVEAIEPHNGYLMAEVSYPEEVSNPEDRETKALAMALMAELKHLVKKSPLFGKDFGVLTPPVPSEEAGRLADMAAILTSAKREQMQAILAQFDVKKRLSQALVMVKEELQLVGLQQKLNQQIEEKVNRQQHNFFLREQLKTIRKELGMESDPKTIEVERFEKRLESLNCPEPVAQVIEDELSKLQMIEPSSPEFNVARNYLDWLTVLPWGIEDKEPLSLKRAKRVLDEDHYGLDEVKDRVVEYLAVHKLKGGDLRGSILCLVGPPGVGKTSMGSSIARTLGRKFFRFSLGGMRDEAEIKGHRRTYVGAMPGKLIQALKRVGTANPVIMLDEVDKLTSSYQGDPSSALLEVLDPEQNHQFLDHYLDVPFDLSDVFFIATANVVDTIPRPLLDRMEIIRLSGYIESEKVAIARKYLLPKQRKEHGLAKEHLNIPATGLKSLARGWAREAGVRQLEQQIAKTCRKVATSLATDEAGFEPITITNEAGFKPFLGEPRFREQSLSSGSRPGLAVGLAWTARGGATLEVEAIAVPGKKSGFKQTGQLGSVMVESAAIAYSYVGCRLGDFGVKPATFHDRFIHLHVPAGATPKDGPSAGITMGCALLSLALGKPLKKKIAMTGELTLTGRILPVGGIREKIIAARRQGISRLILPADNERDLKELPDHLTRGLTFHLVSHFDEVPPLAITGIAGGTGKKGRG